MDSINKKNIHKNKRMSAEKNISMLDRLYTNDIKKRKEKQKLLLQIYTPSFIPNIYTKNENMKRNINIKRSEKTHKQNSVDNNAFNKTYYGNEKNGKEDKHINYEDDDDNYFYENNYLNVNNDLKFKKKYSQNIDYINGEFFEDGEEGRAIVENAFRDRLFKNKKHTTHRNKSVEM